MRIQSSSPLARAASFSGIVPLKAPVKKAIGQAAGALTPASLKGKKISGLLLGTYIQAGAVKLPKSLNPKGLPVNAFVCMNGNGGVVEPGQTVNGNSAQHFYVSIGKQPGGTIYGPFPFTNPLIEK